MQDCSLDFVSCLVSALSLLMSIHDDNGHDEEANVSQEDQHHWNKEGPDE